MILIWIEQGHYTASTSGVHVGKTTSDKDKTVAPSYSSRINTHVSDVTKTIYPTLPRKVHDILASHSYDNLIWDQSNSFYVLVDTINSAEDLAGTHFMVTNIIIDIGIQTVVLLATLWISYRHPARNKRFGYLFEFLL